MYHFDVHANGSTQSFTLSIEKRTSLLVLEWLVPNEVYPRYIRMTTQQADKFRQILFNGAFSSSTIPRNDYSLDMNKGIITIKCHEEKQVIEFPVEGFAYFDRYYNKHKVHIEKYDAKFRSRK